MSSNWLKAGLLLVFLVASASTARAEFRHCVDLFDTNSYSNKHDETTQKFAAESRSRFAEVLGVSSSDRESIKNVFDLVGFGPKDGQNIVILGSDQPFIGDWIVSQVLQIQALHALFPSSKITVIHSFAKLLQRSEWLNPVVPEGAAFTKTNAALERNTSSQDFLVSFYGLPVLVLAHIGCPAIQISTSFYSPQSLSLKVGIFNPNGNQHSRPLHWQMDPAMAKAIPYAKDVPSYVEAQISIPDVTEWKTRYDQSFFETSLLFGNKTPSKSPIEYFADLSGSAEPTKNFLQSTFHTSDEVSYVVVNLNTAGPYKFRTLRPNYGALARKIVQAVLDSDPKIRILITTPELAFGQQAIDAIDKLVTTHSKRVAYMPIATELWMNLIHDSKYVLTQDSGFTHMSLMAKDERDVFTFGIGGPPRSGPAYWRKNSQPFSVLNLPEHESDPDISAIVNWIHVRMRSTESQ